MNDDPCISDKEHNRKKTDLQELIKNAISGSVNFEMPGVCWGYSRDTEQKLNRSQAGDTPLEVISKEFDLSKWNMHQKGMYTQQGSKFTVKHRRLKGVLGQLISSIGNGKTNFH